MIYRIKSQQELEEIWGKLEEGDKIYLGNGVFSLPDSTPSGVEIIGAGYKNTTLRLKNTSDKMNKISKEE